ncbi:hypothetical protein FDECE_5685 [Fusarium decemcellulare]|nr:hypothetical protein FDECE_5685 [Fusarium decemcellulare]
MALEQVARIWGHIFRGPRQTFGRLSVFLLASILLLLFIHNGWPAEWRSVEALSEAELTNITHTATDFAENTIKPPYKHQFWEAGQRSKQLGRWLSQADKLKSKTKLHVTIEETAQHLFPFLRNPPRKPKTKSPLADLRSSYKRGSQGIVIPVGGGDQSVRFASHLIVSLRNVLGSQLPIQIVYAGDEDLPKDSRDKILSLDTVKDVEFLDIFTVFDDATLKLADGGWAIKPFAVLASKFEQTILMDADAVFLQKPEVLFHQAAYTNKGAYLFHDRLLWQHAFQERHEWWRDQIKEPSSEMNKSLVWTEDYAEECDSGVVVVDKSRVSVLVGLLHVAWQNTYDVREEVTYRLGHGDKESWWLGFELAGSTYEFEAHYGSMIGWGHGSDEENVTRVYSFVIAHLDEKNRLIWYNGSLLKNKRADPEGYKVPEYWMTNGKWHKGRTKDDMSCMTDVEAIHLTEKETRVLGDSIDAARAVDKVLMKDKSPG